MKLVIVPAAVVLWVGLAQVVLAVPAGKARAKGLAALEQKMVGVWKGQGGCDGRLIFRADGTYALTGYGPAGNNSKGTWKVRWDALPATLVLTCTTSEIPQEKGKSREVKLIKLDDRNLVFKYANQNGSPSGHYTKVKK
jgi:hypothetical protein